MTTRGTEPVENAQEYTCLQTCQLQHSSIGVKDRAIETQCSGIEDFNNASISQALVDKGDSHKIMGPPVIVRI